MRIDSQKLIALSDMSRDERTYACSLDFILFFAYYFCEYVKYPFASFHYEMGQDIMDLDSLKIRELAWITGRDLAKTSFGKGYAVWTIAYKKSKYMNVDCYERDNSERILFDVVNILQTNQKIRADFGELFNQQRNPNEKLAKRISDFVTSNDIRVEAHTTQESIRGRLHKSYRPDWVWLDDYETLVTARSEAATKQVREHFAELKGGIDQREGKILYTSNWLTESGTVADIVKRGAIDKNLRVRKVFLLNAEGTPSWPERHVLTDAELTIPANKNKVSVESLRRAMRNADTGDMDFEREYLGNVIDPMGDGPDEQGFMPLFRKEQLHFTNDRFPTNPPYLIGVDPGGDGDDETAIVVRSAFSAAVYATEKKSTGKSVAKLVIDAMKEFNVPAHHVTVDSFGVGFKALQELSLLGHRVNAVNVGELADGFDKEGYLNDRAYGFFRLRDWIIQGGLLCDDPAWESELKCIRFIIDGKNKRRIMPKKEIQKRGYKSPNKADALMLSFLLDMPTVQHETMQAEEPRDKFNPFAL